MKKIWFSVAALLLSGSLSYGIPFDQSDQGGFVPESYVVPAAESSSLTPKRAQPATVVQHVPVPVPMPVYQSYQVESPVMIAPIATVAHRTETPVYYQEPVNSGFDPHVYAELDRMSSAIQQLQKSTAPPDTRRSFSAPRVGGRMFFTSYTVDNKGSGTTYEDKAGLQELRLTLTGTGYEAFDYKVEINFHGGTVGLNDLWIGAKNVPLFGYLRAGHFNVEISPAYLGGTSHNTLIETTPPASLFHLSRRFGIGSEHLFAQDRIRWFVGMFQGSGITPTATATNPNGNRFIDVDDQGYILNTRLTAAPYYADGGRKVLHVGGSYAYVVPRRNPNPPGVSATLGGSGWYSGYTPTLSTGVFAENADRYHHRSGIELMYQSGPFGARSEAHFAQYSGANNRMARGTSVEFTYFLTGDHRAYNLATGTFGAAVVKRPFQPFKNGGWNLVNGLGAWQFATQYSYVDLGDWRIDATTGGYQHDLTFGMNWFWNPNMRWVVAYTRSQQDVHTDGHRHQDIFGVSARVHW